MTLQLLFLAALTGLAPVGGDPVPAAATRAGAGNPSLVEGSFRVDRGAAVSLWVPPDERLEFEVHVDLGILGEVQAGTVTMRSGLEPFVAGLPRPGESLGQRPLVGWVSIRARGEHLGYELDHTMTTRFLPQAYPRIVATEVQKGSEHRQRELKLGPQGEAWAVTYRSDGHCRDCTRREHYVEAALPWNADHHCGKCKRAEHRLWGQAREREVPKQAIDILGAVYLARDLVRGGRDSMQLAMLQKDNLWDVTLTRGRRAEVEASDGRYACREVRLSVAIPEGEPDDGRSFSGLFGIKGDLKIWLHESTGVPVMIEGDVPVGDILDLHATVRLASHRGTPAAFLAE